MTRQMSWLRVFQIAWIAAAAGLSGCNLDARADRDKPKMGPGEGAISGSLLAEDKQSFDLSLARDGQGNGNLRIELISPAEGLSAVTFPQERRARFTFNNVKPGSYELSVYCVIPGKRTIAGSLPVTVNAAQATPVKVTLHVTPEEGSEP